MTVTQFQPPAGWLPHPDAPGWFYCGQDVLTEQQLRDRFSPPAEPAIPIDELTRKYRALRDKMDEIKTRQQAELKPFSEAMEQIETMVGHALDTLGVNSMKSDAGTVFKSTRRSMTVGDAAAFREWVNQTGRTDFFENRVSKDALEAYAAEGNPLPPGIKVSSFTTINFRKS